MPHRQLPLDSMTFCSVDSVLCTENNVAAAESIDDLNDKIAGQLQEARAARGEIRTRTLFEDHLFEAI